MGEEKRKTANEIETEIAAREAAVSGDQLIIVAVASAVAQSAPKEGTITDTSKMSSPGTANLLACQMLTGRAIEHMEERGQRELVGQCSRLPTEGTKGEEKTWAKMGVEIVAIDEKDPIFTVVELPAGWELRSTNHAMWSDLVDADGVVRAQIFYKAAFYDRKARAHLQKRFSFQLCSDDCMRGEHPTRAGCAAEYRAKVVDNRTSGIAHLTEWYGDGEPEGDWTPTGMEPAREKAKEWLEQNYPDWQNPTAYW